MVIDTSAVVAALAGEPEAPLFRRTIRDGDGAIMSAFNVYECRVVLRLKFSLDMVMEFNLLMADANIEVFAFDDNQAALAYQAYGRYGKGSGHPARLNLGDCAAYALAQSLDLPLLYKGNDFAATDVRLAV